MYVIEMASDSPPSYWTDKGVASQPQGHFGTKEKALAFDSQAAAQSYIEQRLFHFQDSLRVVPS